MSDKDDPTQAGVVSMAIRAALVEFDPAAKSTTVGVMLVLADLLAMNPKRRVVVLKALLQDDTDGAQALRDWNELRAVLEAKGKS